MKKTRWFSLTALVVPLALACGGGNGNGPEDAGVDSGQPPAECDKAENAAKKAELLAAQPSLGIRSKAEVTAAVTWTSLSGDVSKTCSVELKFKDSNDNGSLDPYENWTLTAEERAEDLAARMTQAQKVGLTAHPITTDAPTTANAAVSTALKALVEQKNVRFGVATANSALILPRATWANNLQELCEASDLGIPFVLSMEPAHSTGGGRAKARGFSQWPHELGLAASDDLAVIEKYGQIVGQEYRAIGVRMALSPSADLFTEPRWFGGQFSFGESAAKVAERVAAYVKGFQGASLGRDSVACVVKHFPGAGPAKDGWDARIEKGRFVAYPANNLDAHLAAFQKALDAGVAGVMPGYAIPEAGTWTGLEGLIPGATIEQVGASFNQTLLTKALREHFQFGGLVLAPQGVLEDQGLSPLGAPWGVETLTRAARAAKAMNAGVDQFAGLADPAPIAQVVEQGLVTEARLDLAARRALALMFKLGLFENPYVDAAKAPSLVNTDQAYQSGLDAMNRSMVLLVNALKPAGWLNGAGDGTQTGDKGNAGNGSLRVLPAPPGEPYVSAGCAYFIMGDFDLDYVRTVSAGYGELTNDATSIDDIPVSTPAERIAMSDYVFIRIPAPFKADPDAGELDLPTGSLAYAGADNASALDLIATARAAIDAWNANPARPRDSKTQIIVGVDAGRPPVVSEILSYGVSGLYLEWSVSDKVFLDIAFGIFHGRGKLPVGVPLSNTAAAAQKGDLPGDGQHETFVEGFGYQTLMFF